MKEDRACWHDLWFDKGSGPGEALSAKCTGEINFLCILRQRLTKRGDPTTSATMDPDQRAGITRRCFGPFDAKICTTKTAPEVLRSDPGPDVLKTLILDATIRSGSSTTYVPACRGPL